MSNTELEISLSLSLSLPPSLPLSQGVKCVIDGIGKATMDISIDSIARFHPLSSLGIQPRVKSLRSSRVG